MPCHYLEDHAECPHSLPLDSNQTYEYAMLHLARNVTDYAIYLLDPHGRISAWNAGAERLKGYSREEVLGKSFAMFFTPEAVAAGVPQKELAAAACNGRFETLDWRQRKGGEKIWALATLTAIRDADGKLQGFAKITRDMTPQKMLDDSHTKLALELEKRVEERTWQLEAIAEELRIKNERIESLLTKIRKDLGEKEVLLREVYHRVKNNLQVVQSLLKMGARAIVSGDGRAAIAAAVERVHVMATVHERLYRMPDLASLTLTAYLPEIAELAIAANSDRANPVQLQMELDDIPLSLDLAVPLGLLVNELISNCLKHGLSKNRPGAILISARIVPGAVRLMVHDNGKGLPENFDASKCQSIGLKLVDSLARQLGGTIKFSSNEGCQVQADLTRLLPQLGQHRPSAQPTELTPVPLR